MNSGRRVVGVSGDAGPEALDEQTVPLACSFAGSGALERAVALDFEWIWFIAPGAQPRCDALERLFEAVQPDGEPPAVLVAGMVLDSNSRPLDHELPAADHTDMNVVIRLVSRGLLPVRHVTFAHCLVERRAFLRHGLPDTRRFGRYAPLDWTARALREGTGYFNPRSVVTLARNALPARESALSATLTTLRMARSGAWTKGESVRALSGLISQNLRTSHLGPHGGRAGRLAELD